MKNNKRFDYTDFYKILITRPVAKKINLNEELPLVEIIELKKTSLLLPKTKIFKEEEKIHNNAPVEIVKIDNISENRKQKTIRG